MIAGYSEYEYERMSMADKNGLIRDKIDELVDLILLRDLNNVGLPWPGDVEIASKLRKLKENFK